MKFLLRIAEWKKKYARTKEKYDNSTQGQRIVKLLTLLILPILSVVSYRLPSWFNISFTIAGAFYGLTVCFLFFGVEDLIIYSVVGFSSIKQKNTQIENNNEKPVEEKAVEEKTTSENLAEEKVVEEVSVQKNENSVEQVKVENITPASKGYSIFVGVFCIVACLLSIGAIVLAYLKHPLF